MLRAPKPMLARARAGSLCPVPVCLGSAKKRATDLDQFQTRETLLFLTARHKQERCKRMTFYSLIFVCSLLRKLQEMSFIRSGDY
jgi:hypothetical protein